MLIATPPLPMAGNTRTANNYCKLGLIPNSSFTVIKKAIVTKAMKEFVLKKSRKVVEGLLSSKPRTHWSSLS